MSPSSQVYSTRPYTIINCAMSVDGKLALPSKKPVKLSSLEDFKRVHELRNFYDGVLVGINTILIDDPKLTVKPEFVPEPKNPVRIVLDSNGRTPSDAAVLDGSAQTYIAVGKGSESRIAPNKNIELIPCSLDDDNFIDLKELLVKLRHMGIDNLLVEGGETVIYNFLKNQFVDELYIYVSNVIIGGTSSPTLAGGSGAGSENEIINLKLLSCDRMGDGILLKYLPI